MIVYPVCHVLTRESGNACGYIRGPAELLPGTVSGQATCRTARVPPEAVVLESEVVIRDPHVTTASIARTFGYCVRHIVLDGPLDGRGRMLMDATDTITANGAESLRVMLKTAFPFMLEVLTKPNAVVPLIMLIRNIPTSRRADAPAT